MIEKLAAKAHALPMKPGVYLMKDAAGKIIYVGKAKLLKNRVSSYFRGAHNEKTQALVSNIADFDVIVATSEFEALVLENSLIKHHMPKYNILLKDDKGYPFVRLDRAADYPELTVVSRTADDGARYFGPYGSRGSTFAALEAMKKALKLPQCARRFPRDIGRERPCLNYHMGACRAYCLRDTPRSEYLQAIDQAVMILEGRSAELLKQLKEEMAAAAQALRFERAAELRDSIKAISLLETKQHAWSANGTDVDAVGFCRGVKSCFVVLHYVDGQLLGKDYELIDEPVEDDDEAVSGLVRQYYTIRASAPKSVLLPFELADAQSLQQLISQCAGRSVTVSVPQRGEKAVYTATAVLNAREEIERHSTREEKASRTAQWLEKALDLPGLPERIEAFDISNTGNDSIVAGMVVFKDGRPLKRDYRHFKIMTTDGQNDYGSMAEAVGRRMARYAAGDEKFAPLPDLLLIDGGAAHAAAAVRACVENGVNVPVFGMVKDDRHRTRALVTPEGHEIGIAAQPHVFAFIGTIQEETHRFAIEYHRKLRSKSAVGSTLDAIPGVGPARRTALLKSFGTVSAVREAELEQLTKVVPKNTAKAVYDYFHGESGE